MARGDTLTADSGRGGGRTQSEQARTVYRRNQDGTLMHHHNRQSLMA